MNSRGAGRGVLPSSRGSEAAGTPPVAAETLPKGLPTRAPTPTTPDLSPRRSPGRSPRLAQQVKPQIGPQPQPQTPVRSTKRTFPFRYLYRVNYSGSLRLEPWGSLRPNRITNIAIKSLSMRRGRWYMFWTPRSILWHLRHRVGARQVPPYSPFISLFSSKVAAERFADELCLRGYRGVAIVTISTRNFVRGLVHAWQFPPVMEYQQPRPVDPVPVYTGSSDRYRLLRRRADIYVSLRDVARAMGIPAYEYFRDNWVAINFVDYDSVVSVEEQN